MCGHQEDSSLNAGVKKRQGLRVQGKNSTCEGDLSPWGPHLPREGQWLREAQARCLGAHLGALPRSLELFPIGCFPTRKDLSGCHAVGRMAGSPYFGSSSRQLWGRGGQ